LAVVKLTPEETEPVWGSRVAQATGEKGLEGCFYESLRATIDLITFE
jgi:hypothetical protein